jgi:hypothetical protein
VTQPAPAGGVLDLLMPQTTEYQIEVAQEKTRGWLAFSLMALLAVLVITLAYAGIQRIDPFDLEALGLLLSGLLSPVIGLLGTVMGFYFGQQSVNR